jgi:hypothetical protein
MRFVFSRKIILLTIILSFFLANISLCQVKKEVLKNLISIKSFQFPFCTESENNCLGYRIEEFVGPDYKISGLLIYRDYVLVVDVAQDRLIKISLSDGEIIKKSDAFPFDGCNNQLREIILFNNKILVLAEMYTAYYEIDSNLVVKREVKLPKRGAFSEFYKKDDSLYILRETDIWKKNNSIFAHGYRIENDLSYIEDTVEVDLDWEKNYPHLYGTQISIISMNSKFYLQTTKYLFELPEIIPNLEEYYVSIGYNKEYLVFFILLENKYEMIVCKYF